ncbi:MAG: hypothetical protein ABFD25_01000 [Clostridiaceae bacterium]
MDINTLMHRDRKEERTGFQEHAPYHPSYDLQADFVMAYGIDETMPERIKMWREKGYVVHLMTGVSWGLYRNYLDGKYDGRDHWDEAQKVRTGKIRLNSINVPYMVPSISYAGFLTERIKAAIDAGAEAIHLEEPEFWADSGYSEAFKREWEIYYKEPWIPPHESVDAQYMASKLKSYLFTRCLDRLCSSLKEYAKVNYGRLLRFYVPTHSLINYSQWRIVSPESRLLNIPTVDGYIAQIWTGTSRVPNVYEGIRKERTFDTAFLEYGIMQELVRGTDRRMWFLHDPIEDDINHTWQDYRENYFRTVVAALLHPGVSNFEVCPWPRRVFNDSYPKSNGKGKETIPPDYATILLTIMHTLADMKQDDVYWEGSSCTIGLLLADSCMFQRALPDSAVNGARGENIKNDEMIKNLQDWSAFFGLALPILKHGMPVRPVQLDNIRRFPGYLDAYKVLVLSYEFMKPEYPDIHNALAQWVRNGGVLVYAGDGTDPFHSVREWWNQGLKQYTHPAEHLFESLGIECTPERHIYNVGSGIFAFLPVHPADCANSSEKADQLRDIIKEAMERKGSPEIRWTPKNSFVMHRGPYTIAAVLDESVSDSPCILKGRFVRLFDANLPVVNEAVLVPGENALLYDLDKIPDNEDIRLIAAASRIEDFKVDDRGFSFIARGPEGVNAVARFYSKRKVSCVKGYIVGKEVRVGSICEDDSKTLLITYPNSADGIKIIVEF